MRQRLRGVWASVGAVVGVAVLAASAQLFPPAHSRAAGPGAEPGRPHQVSAARAELPDLPGGAVDRLLAARAAALADADVAAWARTVAEPDGAQGRRLVAQFGVLRALGVDSFAYGGARFVAAPEGTDPTSAAIDVDVRYRLRGFDTEAAHAVERLLLTRHGTDWRISKVLDDAGPEMAPVWALPGVEVVRGPRVVIAGDAPSAQLRGLALMAETAIEQVDDLWPLPWPARLVVLVPAGDDSFTRLVGSGGDHSQVGALTAGSLGPDGRARADRIVLNPDASARLSDQGRQFLLTHEAQHVAVRASLPGRLPTWFSEGLADYTAYRPLRVDPHTVSPQLMAQVAAGRWPARLPTEADFTAPGASLPALYGASWLAVDELIRRYGEGRTLALFSACATPVEQQSGLPSARDAERGCRAAFEPALHTSVEEFTALWSLRVRELAAG